jgi:hypothetical protein
MSVNITSNILYNVSIRDEIIKIKKSKMPEMVRDEFCNFYKRIGDGLKRRDPTEVMLSAGVLKSLSKKLGRYELERQVGDFISLYHRENVLKLIKESEKNETIPK